jgi:hypothetical protein
VAEITETDYFQDLQRKARRLRAGSAGGRRTGRDESEDR